MKPNRSLKRLRTKPGLTRDVLWLIGLTLVLQFIEYGGWLAAIDGRFLNTWLTHVKNEQPFQNSIFLVDIDDNAYQTCFRSTSPLDPSKVRKMVELTTSADPAVIGVDLLTDTRTGTSGYSPLLNASPPKGQTIVWISGIDEKQTRYETANFFYWLFGGEDYVVVKPTGALGVEPAELVSRNVKWGLPVYPRDEDLQVRSINRCLELSADPSHSSIRVPQKSWPGLVAESYDGVVTDCTRGGERVYLNFGGPTPTKFAFGQVFKCSGNPGASVEKNSSSAFWTAAKHKIILIGGTFASARDSYLTPKGSLSGLEINAYAVRSELAAAPFREVGQPASLLLDLAVGVMTLWLTRSSPFRAWIRKSKFTSLARSHTMRLGILISVGLWVIVVFAAWQIAGGYLMGIAGIIFGLLADCFVTTLRENPALPEEEKSIG